MKMEINQYKICKLCKSNENLQKHHIIPQSIIKKINPNSELKQFKIWLCEKCHREVHNSFLIHYQMSYKIGNFSNVEILNYYLLKIFLLSKYYKIWNEFKEFKKENFKKILDELVKECDDNDNEEK
jgi:hypothetical protein